ETSPAVSAGRVVMVAEDYDSGTVTVLGLDADTGERAWRFVPDGVALGSSAAVIADGVVVLGIGDIRMHGLRLRDGAHLWDERGRAAYGARFTPAGGDPVVVGDRAGHVTAVEPRSGKERWLYRVPGDLLLGGAVFLDARWVAIGDGSGEVTAIDARTGHLAWRTNLGARRVEAPAADGEHLYVAQRGGPVFAFEHDPRGMLLDEPSPTTLFPVRALAGWALAAGPIYVLIVLLFRVVRSRQSADPSEEPA
ncbi:MAG TPA: PQQ-binding-like beta-propeller repeat protein, partial [Actinomycetota bacterium]|nr:PQQ-binding-like beta-propeller repeat protein [Actinomycetota bacterium]